MYGIQEKIQNHKMYILKVIHTKYDLYSCNIHVYANQYLNREKIAKKVR